ncbi:MAG: hypothetical protein GEV08_04705 [Acidimicrobiia bacterium]|nr:hypothetical protein [Acidimicrobiia bacterium]
MAHDCFAQCTPGLEGVLAGEVAALGVRAVKADRGGVGFRATTRQVYAANVWLRSANRVLLRVAAFPARTWDQLEAGAATVDWWRFLGPGAPAAFRVSSSSSKLYHTEAIAERLGRVVSAAVPPRRPDGRAERRARHLQGAGPPRRSSQPPAPPGSPPGAARGAGPVTEGALVVARVLRDRVVLSVDTSGEPLHRRGWRQQTARAPLRETLAAAVVLASGWDAASPLVDPFCGSGTIAIEAALVARDLAPGRDRGFAFQAWPTFEAGTWASVRGEVAARARPLHAGASIAGADRDAGAVEAARANAARAGVAEDVSFGRASISDLVPPAARSSAPPGRSAGDAPGGWLVTNPPYGGRASAGHDLRDLYARLGDVARDRLRGWRAALLVADTRLAAQARLGLAEQLRTANGGLDVRLLVADIPGLAPLPG